MSKCLLYVGLPLSIAAGFIVMGVARCIVGTAKHLDGVSVRVALDLLLAIAAIFTVVLMAKYRRTFPRRPISTVMNMVGISQTELFIEKYQNLIGVYVFGTGAIALCAYQILSSIQCLESFERALAANFSSVEFKEQHLTKIGVPENTQKIDTYYEKAGTLSYYFFKIFFFFLQIPFLLLLDRSMKCEMYSMKRLFLHVTIATVIAADLVMWFNTFIAEGHFIKKFRYPVSVQSQFSGLDFDCLNGSAVLQTLDGNLIQPILYPLTTEYVMCGMEIIYHFWSSVEIFPVLYQSIESSVNQDTQDVENIVHCQHSEHTGTETVREPNQDNGTPDEYVSKDLPPVRVTGKQNFEGSKVDVISGRRQSKRVNNYQSLEGRIEPQPTRIGYRFVSKIMNSKTALLLTILHCVGLHVYNTIHDKVEKHEADISHDYFKDNVNEPLLIFRIILFSLLLGGALLVLITLIQETGWKAGFNLTPVESHIKIWSIERFIILLAGAGLAAHCIVEMNYAIMGKIDSEEKWLTFFCTFIGFLEIPIQIIILIKGRNIVLGKQGFDKIQHIMTFITFINFGLWATNSFAEISYQASRLSYHYGETGAHFLLHFSFPLAIYFRYYCAAILLKTKNTWLRNLHVQRDVSMSGHCLSQSVPTQYVSTRRRSSKSGFLQKQDKDMDETSSLIQTEHTPTYGQSDASNSYHGAAQSDRGQTFHVKSTEI